MGLRVLVEDGLSMRKGAGIARHTMGLVEQLEAADDIESVTVFRKPVLSSFPTALLRRACYGLWLNSGLQLALRAAEFDIVHFTNFLIPFLRLSRARYVVTIHDLGAWVVPECLPAAYIPYIRSAVKHAVKRADMIVTPSEAIAGEIQSHFGMDDSRIRVVHNGLSSSFRDLPKRTAEGATGLRNRFGIRLDADVVLFVGTVEKRKNLRTLVKAVGQLKAKASVQLVLVGRAGFGFDEVQRCITEEHLDHDVVVTGYVTEEEKVGLYDLAKVFAFPSLYEGFGIPLVEAMSRGVPIVASRIPSTEEVVRDAGLLYDDPPSRDALADGLLRALTDETLQESLVDKGLKRARDFSKEALGRELLGVYRDVLERPPC